MIEPVTDPERAIFWRKRYRDEVAKRVEVERMLNDQMREYETRLAAARELIMRSSLRSRFNAFISRMVYRTS